MNKKLENEIEEVENSKDDSYRMLKATRVIQKKKILIQLYKERRQVGITKIKYIDFATA